MLFTDSIFAVLMMAVFCLYWLALRRSPRWQNLLLLAASYVFYGWWDWRFLGLILLTSLTTFTAALVPRRRGGRTAAAANIVFNLAILVVFKYFNFFSENLGRLFELFGLGLDWFTIDVLLPVGISFYTFQAIGYSVDVVKGRVDPCRNPVTFCTFIAFFPQLVAGPIERASAIIPQLEAPRRWESGRAAEGLRMIMFGLVKKLCIADMIALWVDRAFAAPHLSAVGVLAAGIAFSIEIYCDFSAYSEIARGTARLLGIELMANFHFPYFSRNIVEFWRRWHISLMEWFRDYVYIPLGGNRRGRGRAIANSMAVFLLSGLWHGAAWNFVLWGAYWAVVYVVAKFAMGQRSPSRPISVRDLPAMIFTFGAVALGFYFFRCPGSGAVVDGLQACWLYAVVFGATGLAARLIANPGRLRVALVVLAVAAFGAALWLWQEPWWTALRWWWLVPAALVAFSEWQARNLAYPLARMPRAMWRRLAFYWACIICIVLSEPTDMSFIYFQF